MEATVNKQMWGFNDLKAMKNINHPCYIRAMELNLPHRLIVNLHKDIRAFKKSFREDYNAAIGLEAIGLGGQQGRLGA